MIKLNEIKVSDENLDRVLARSYEEFIKNPNLYPNFRLRFKLGINNHLTEARYYEISESNSICASFMLIFSQMKLSGSSIKICFLTQVIVSKTYRGLGMTYKLSEYAERLAINEGAGVTFVIARRNVKDLYGKLGFVGFSHFSKLELCSTPAMHKSHLRRTRQISGADLKILVKLHEESYSDLRFNFDRSEKNFENIMKLPNFRIRISEDNSFYLINNSKSIVEVGMKTDLDGPEILAIGINEGLESVNINRNHKLFHIGVEMGLPENEHFEVREGHLLKLHRNNLSLRQLIDLEVFTQNPGNQYAEISEIDQW